MAGSKPKIVLEGIAGAWFIGATVLLSPLLRPWYSRWGTTGDEAERAFPGDEFVPHPGSQITAAITVHAPVESVWPWFVQLGCQRAGWYSYDLLDNGGRPSADRIVPEYQHLAVGDVVKALPNGAFGFPVALVEPDRVLTLGGTTDTSTGKPVDPNDPDLKTYFSGDQTFYLVPLGERSTRLLFRMRIGWNPSRLNNLIYRGIVEPISFVMGRKMLLTIKQRAEFLATTS